MLTPPGLKGKQYRISGKAYPRLSRPGQKRRRVLKILAAVVAVAVLGWGTVQLVTVFGGKKKPVAAAKNCTHQAAAVGGDAAKPSASAMASAAASASGGAAPIALPSGVPQPATITVNVYNATNHVGLAGQTAAQLKLRGFKIGKIANAPVALQNKITGAAQVTGAATSRAALSLLGSEVSGATTTTDARKDASVDFFVGNGFTALLTPAQVAQALALAASPSAAAAAHC
ncbi:LytR C-terminal domain-containing protein [Streptacidiphilus sp. MAP12-20]|uniref:LytR C-terminal domain-containing protein n=1 Tax=Streptacidiphilus sp. MAP12-20 TaxID=3156299 RepID=UPI0035139FAD